MKIVEIFLFWRPKSSFVFLIGVPHALFLNIDSFVHCVIFGTCIRRICWQSSINFIIMASPAPLTLPVGVTENSVSVHPVVLFTICDAYIRRNEDQQRVIGTLLGTIGDGIIDIRNCYAVPHTENNEQVRVNCTSHRCISYIYLAGHHHYIYSKLP